MKKSEVILEQGCVGENPFTFSHSGVSGVCFPFIASSSWLRRGSRCDFVVLSEHRTLALHLRHFYWDGLLGLLVAILTEGAVHPDVWSLGHIPGNPLPSGLCAQPLEGFSITAICCSPVPSQACASSRHRNQPR